MEPRLNITFLELSCLAVEGSGRFECETSWSTGLVHAHCLCVLLRPLPCCLQLKGKQHKTPWPLPHCFTQTIGSHRNSLAPSCGPAGTQRIA